jgi:hypothetical protein
MLLAQHGGVGGERSWPAERRTGDGEPKSLLAARGATAESRCFQQSRSRWPERRHARYLMRPTQSATRWPGSKHRKHRPCTLRLKAMSRSALSRRGEEGGLFHCGHRCSCTSCQPGSPPTSSRTAHGCPTMCGLKLGGAYPEKATAGPERPGRLERLGAGQQHSAAQPPVA